MHSQIRLDKCCVSALTVIRHFFLSISAANFCPQTYASEDAVTFLVATGTDEGKTSRIVLWDTAGAPYDSNGEPFRFLCF